MQPVVYHVYLLLYTGLILLCKPLWGDYTHKKREIKLHKTNKQINVTWHRLHNYYEIVPILLSAIVHSWKWGLARSSCGVYSYVYICSQVSHPNSEGSVWVAWMTQHNYIPVAWMQGTLQNINYASCGYREGTSTHSADKRLLQSPNIIIQYTGAQGLPAKSMLKTENYKIILIGSMKRARRPTKAHSWLLTCNNGCLAGQD